MSYVFYDIIASGWKKSGLGMHKHRCQINNNILIKIEKKILITCKLFEG